METYIELTGLHFYAYHGVAPQERIVGNNYEVNLKVAYPFEQAMTSDDLTHTLNYAHLYEVIEEEMMQPSLLLEHVAGRIVAQLEARFPAITSLQLKVTKLKPPIRGEVEAASVIVCK